MLASLSPCLPFSLSPPSPAHRERQPHARLRQHGGGLNKNNNIVTSKQAYTSGTRYANRPTDYARIAARKPSNTG